VKAIPVPLEVAAVAAVVAAMGFLLLRSVRDFQRHHTARGVLQLVCAAFGGAFIGFTYWTAHLPELRGSAWTVRDALVRAGAIVAGVVFLVGTVVALVPWALDRLENGTFPLYIAARHVRAK
jgi:hypothetical protein